MANNFKHFKTITNTIKIKGDVTVDSNDAYITYIKDREEYTINVRDLFSLFSGEKINCVISTKEETDLDD